MDKRGVSALITTVLIIGITLSAFGIIYSFVVPIIKDEIQGTQECSDVSIPSC